MPRDKALICKKLCQRLVEEIHAQKGWSLPPEWLEKLHDETWPHIRASIPGIWEFLGEEPGKEGLQREWGEEEAAARPSISPTESIKSEKTGISRPQASREIQGAGENLGEPALSPEDLEMIRTIVINYYHYGPDVKALRSSMGVSSKYYDYFRKVIYKKFKYYLPGDLDQEDLINEGWVKLLEKCHLYHFRSMFTTWAYQVFLNAAHELIRSEKRYQVRFTHSLDDAKDNDAVRYNDMLVAASNIEEEISDKEQINIKKKVIAMAVEKTRNAVRDDKVLELYQSDKKYKEIAQELNLNINTVAIIIHRIKKQLNPPPGLGAEEKTPSGEGERDIEENPGKARRREEIPQP